MSVPWKARCCACREVIPLDGGNTRCGVFACQPWFNYFEVVCGCGKWMRVFRIDADDVEAARRGRFAMREEDFAPEDVVASYERTMDVRMPEAKPLTPRQERLVAFAAFLLARGEHPLTSST